MWLGTATIATKLRSYRSYDEAVSFVHKLKLKNHLDWTAYCRGERKDLPPRPHDIPTNPNVTYGEEFRHKGGWGAWLDTGNVARRGRLYNASA